MQINDTQKDKTSVQQRAPELSPTMCPFKNSIPAISRKSYDSCFVKTTGSIIKILQTQ